MRNAQSMAASQREATDLFRAWQVDRALIRIEFRLRALTTTLLARVSAASDHRLTLRTEREWTELVMPLPSGAIFRYLDLWAVPQAERFERVIVVFYPDANPCTADPEKLEQVVFAEVREWHAGG
jgi:hypothetical protein